jgi:hypothetical protein
MPHGSVCYMSGVVVSRLGRLACSTLTVRQVSLSLDKQLKFGWQHAAVLHASPKGGSQCPKAEEANAVFLQGNTDSRVLVEP